MRSVESPYVLLAPRIGVDFLFADMNAHRGRPRRIRAVARNQGAALWTAAAAYDVTGQVFATFQAAEQVHDGVDYRIWSKEGNKVDCAKIGK